MTTKKTVPDEVLEKLAKLAGVSLAPEIGLLAEAHKRFFSNVRRVVTTANMDRAALKANDVANLKKIERLSEALTAELTAAKAKLPSAIVSAEVFNSLEGVALGAKSVKQFAAAKTPAKRAAMIRNAVIEGLLDAAARAGGRLSLNRLNEGNSSLVVALELLMPYLPMDKAPSFSTLRLTYDPWLKKQRQKRPRLKKRNIGRKKPTF